MYRYLGLLHNTNMIIRLFDRLGPMQLMQSVTEGQREADMACVALPICGTVLVVFTQTEMETSASVLLVTRFGVFQIAT